MSSMHAQSREVARPTFQREEPSRGFFPLEMSNMHAEVATSGQPPRHVASVLTASSQPQHPGGPW